ncbi:D-glycerate 3-kinase, chloroplastic [Galdieria sulphuraria]|nr:D-glycerate 3-kinase, chloroplastic [Galdieria sulphuraria]
MNGSYCGQQTTAEIPKDCILSSPVFQATGLLWQDIPQKEWGRLANLLIQKLKLDPTLPETNVRIHQLYLPIFFWLKKEVEKPL